MNGQPSVLIVDRSEETREVLRTALERHGVKTMSACRAANGIRLARQHQPDIIVLDLDVEDVSDYLADGAAFLTPEDARHDPDLPQNQPYQPRLVLLGKMRGWQERIPSGEFVAKPYHFAPLIRKIEELLAK